METNELGVGLMLLLRNKQQGVQNNAPLDLENINQFCSTRSLFGRTEKNSLNSDLFLYLVHLDIFWLFYYRQFL